MKLQANPNTQNIQSFGQHFKTVNGWLQVSLYQVYFKNTLPATCHMSMVYIWQFSTS